MTMALWVRLLCGFFSSSTSAPAWCSLAVEVGGFFSPVFCERAGFFDGIPDDGGVSGGSWWFRSSVVWLAASDLLSSLVLHKMVADGLSSSMVCFGDGTGFCGFNNVWHLL
jgi:hypothetical protein